jgi:hypothetical protein
MSHQAQVLRAEIRELEALREALNRFAAHIEECIWWSVAYPVAVRAHRLDLDDINGDLDEISDRLGPLKRDLGEIEGRLGMAEHIADVAAGRNP